MQKIIILVAILCSVAIASNYTCPYDQTKDFSSQVESCKLQILKGICEQIGISVWSSTTTKNNTLKADEIKTTSQCNSTGINISNIVTNDTTMKVTYTSVYERQEVHEVTMEAWNDLSVATSKTKVSKAKVTRPDSTTLTDLVVSMQVDSRKIRKQLEILEDKTNRIINIMLE